MLYKFIIWDDVFATGDVKVAFLLTATAGAAIIGFLLLLEVSLLPLSLYDEVY